MNRLAVVLFAVAILLAHALAIHQTQAGEYAPPYDLAHVGYRVARNLVREGTPAWNAGESLDLAYPSPAWILVAATAERFSIGPNQLTQLLGTLCVLASAFVLAQFSPKRMGGLIAPVLLAASGAAAAAGGSGTEAGLAMLLVTTAALAFERRNPRIFGASAALLVWTRPEAIALVGVAFLLELLDRPREPLGGRGRPLSAAFLVPLAAWLALVLVRRLASGVWLSPLERTLLGPEGERLALGLDYLQGFLFASGSALLIVLPTCALLTGHQSARGRRMLVLSAAWCALVALAGGDGLPFWNALAPILPLFFLAIQEAITAWLDRAHSLAALFSALLLAAVGASLLASRIPTDIGPFRIESWHRAWMEPEPRLVAAYGRSHGRLGLIEEIRDVERLRSVGVYLRDRVPDSATVATYWPGAIAYLSRRHVTDILGRATPLRGAERLRPWRGATRVDLVEECREGADYLIPILGGLREGASPADLLHTWLERYDVVGDREARLLDLLASLAEYELVAVPVPAHSRRPEVTAEEPFLLLRDRAKKEAPTVAVVRQGHGFRVEIDHTSNQQVADLSVFVHLADGGVRTMRPTGELVPGRVVARANLLLYASGSRPIRALEAELSPELDVTRVVAQLHNPGTSSDVPLAAVGAPAELAWSRGAGER